MIQLALFDPVSCQTSPQPSRLIFIYLQSIFPHNLFNINLPVAVTITIRVVHLFLLLFTVSLNIAHSDQTTKFRWQFAAILDWRLFLWFTKYSN